MKVTAQPQLCGNAQCSRYCNGMNDCGEKLERMAGILAAVDDCKGVLALRIGDEKSETKGIRVFTLATKMWTRP